MQLTGGGAMLSGLSEYFAERIGLPCRLAEDPIACVAIGTGRVLEDLPTYRRALSEYRRVEYYSARASTREPQKTGVFRIETGAGTLEILHLSARV